MLSLSFKLKEHKIYYVFHINSVKNFLKSGFLSKQKYTLYRKNRKEWIIIKNQKSVNNTEDFKNTFISGLFEENVWNLPVERQSLLCWLVN